VYAPVGDVERWSCEVVRILDNPAAAPARSERLAWGKRFSWSAHAEIVASTYHQVKQDL
jgi:hypothetical protein